APPPRGPGAPLRGAARPPSPGEVAIAKAFAITDDKRPADPWLLEAVRWAWRVKIHPHLELELIQRLREAAEAEAIRVFGANLKDLLLAAPAGPRVTLGIDPGLRTGIKVAVVDATGRLLETATCYPHPPQKRWDEALHTLETLCSRHGVALIAIGNGTASRETVRLVQELCTRKAATALQWASVSEAGASVYSASALAAAEFPELDVSLRGAVSIARRLQDPLAELVKIDPKAIGVGQYQHDVSQTRLAKALDAVVEDCVNAVGVDVNTASGALLSRVAGLTPGVAQHIVAYRDDNGAFTNRRQLLKVPRLGAKTFEQAAGFLRLSGDNPLDRSAVHPEAYPVVERIVKACGRPVERLLGDRAFLATLTPKAFTDARFGLPTVKDIIAELEKPGRDPRPAFATANFKEGVERLEDLEAGMILEGVVTNVANFGAFVDVGVHQDGLVHISMMAHHFVKDPRAVVKAGDVVKVKVMAVDAERRRIGLSLRLDDPLSEGEGEAQGPAPSPKAAARRPSRRADQPPRDKTPPERPTGALADAFQRAKRR
ncbi:MAG: helix-hairpin-helix domain-containing protein, partial [Candidatus Competibacterales bacterium]